MTRKRASYKPPKLAADMPTPRRTITQNELALWQQVTDQATPLPRNLRPEPLPQYRPIRLVAPEPTQVLDRPAGPARRGASLNATLDHIWDRKLAKGALVPDLVIDLHGYNLVQAHHLLVRGISRAIHQQVRVVLIITGKGDLDAPAPKSRGILRDMLLPWLESPEIRPYVASVRQAHAKHGGMGAWYAILRRPRSFHLEPS